MPDWGDGGDYGDTWYDSELAEQQCIAADSQEAANRLHAWLAQLTELPSP